MAQTSYSKPFVGSDGKFYARLNDDQWCVYTTEEDFKKLGLITPPYSVGLFKLGFWGHIKNKDIGLFYPTETAAYTFEVYGSINRTYKTTLGGIIIDPKEFVGKKFTNHIRGLIEEYGFSNIKWKNV